MLDLSELDIVSKDVAASCPKAPFIPLFSLSLKEIEAQAFAGTAIQRLLLPASAKTVGYGAFANCAELLDIDLPNVAYVDRMAFANCKKLSYASIGAARFIADTAFLYSGIKELHVSKPGNYVKAMPGWPFGIAPSKIMTLPDASPFLNLAWDSDRRLLREVLGNTHSQMYATSLEFKQVVDFSDCSILTNSIIRSRISDVSKRVKPVLGSSLSAITDRGFSWHTGIVELKGLQQVKAIGPHAFEGTKTEVPCCFGCNVLSAEAFYGFTQQKVQLSGCWLGEHALWNGPEVELCGAVCAESYALDCMSVTLLSGFKLAEMAFGCKDGLSAGNAHATLCAFWDELEADNAWPFGLKLENINAIERKSKSSLHLAPAAKLRRLHDGQAYCRRSSSICDATNAIAFTKASLEQLSRRYGQTWTSPIDIVFSDKLKHVASDAFDDCLVMPRLHR